VYYLQADASQSRGRIFRRRRPGCCQTAAKDRLGTKERVASAGPEDVKMRGKPLVKQKQGSSVSCAQPCRDGIQHFVRRPRSEQHFTSSECAAHFRRHATCKPHDFQIFVGSCAISNSWHQRWLSSSVADRISKRVRRHPVCAGRTTHWHDMSAFSAHPCDPRTRRSARADDFRTAFRYSLPGSPNTAH